MIKEFALDPAALAKWDDCRYLTALFGAENGRVIAKYPKKWKRLAYEAAQKVAEPTELSKIEERLRRLDDSVLFYMGRPGGENEDWQVNALEENKRQPFGAIVCSESSNEDVISVDDVDELKEPFIANRQVSVNRDASSMASALDLIFKSGKHYKFIDKYLSPTPRYIKPLKKFITGIASRGVVTAVVIELVIGTDGNAASEDTMARNFNVVMNGFLPEGIEMKIYFLPKEKMHDRWILAEWCGVQFGQGLDEGDNPPDVNITLLDESRRQELWDEFSFN